MRRDLEQSALRQNQLCLISVVLMLLAALVVPSIASAGETRVLEPFSPITGGGSGVTIIAPGGIAIDEVGGNVFVKDDGGGYMASILGARGHSVFGFELISNDVTRFGDVEIGSDEVRNVEELSEDLFRGQKSLVPKAGTVLVRGLKADLKLVKKPKAKKGKKNRAARTVSGFTGRVSW